MVFTLALALLKSAIKNPKKSADVDKALIELRDALIALYPVN